MSSVAFLGPQNAPKPLSTVASSQNSNPAEGAYNASLDTLAGFKGPTFKTLTSNGRKERGGGKGERRGAKMIYAPRRQKPLRHHCGA